VPTEPTAARLVSPTDHAEHLMVVVEPEPSVKRELLPVASVSNPLGPVFLVASSGGHLAQLVALEGWWRDKERVWVTFDKSDARSQLAAERVAWAHHPTTRNVKNLLRNTVLAFRLLRRHRPAMVVSTGAAVAFPFFVFARLMGIPTIYIEVFDRLDSRTLTGRLCRPFATRFFVQWEQQRVLYPGSTLIGTLL
jgi:UDP-N-acetylglucosamine:LPS N-acetylglucosamine transferase